MEVIFTLFLEPLSHPFMQRALIAAIFIGVSCAIFSCYLILKGWSLMGDAVSHSVLPGIAIAYVINIPLIIGAFISGLFCALLTGYLSAHTRIKEDAVMGILFSGMFGLGIVMLSKIETDIHLLHVLFGNILGISSSDLIQSIIIISLCASLMLIKRRDLFLYCFDPAHAQVIGIPVKWLSITLLCLLSLTIVSSLKAAGIILVIAMLIAPGATGFLLSNSFDRMMGISIITALSSGVTGTLLSYHFDTATAPLIVIIQASLFLMALLISKTSKQH